MAEDKRDLKKQSSQSHKRSLTSIKRFFHIVRGYFPLTLRGLLLLGSSLLFLFVYGVKEDDWVLLFLGGAGLFLITLNLLLVIIPFFWIIWKIRLLNELKQIAPISGETQTPIISGFLLPSIKIPMLDFSSIWLEPSVDVEFHPYYPSVSELLIFHRRQSFSQVHRLLSLRDLFGLAEISWERWDPQEGEIWPYSQPHPPISANALIEGEGHFVPNRPRVGDRIDTRPYLPGDPYRYIHWKLFARKGEPIVRVPEPSASTEKKIMAYLVCDELDEFAAEITRWSLENGDLGTDWHFATDGSPDPVSNVSSALSYLAHSAQFSHRAGKDLPTFLSAISFEPSEQHLLIFTSGYIERWLPNIKALLQKHTSSITLIIASEYDDIQEKQKTAKSTSLWKRLFFIPQYEPPKAPPNQWQILRDLSRDGLHLQLFHRSDFAYSWKKTKNTIRFQSPTKISNTDPFF